MTEMTITISCRNVTRRCYENEVLASYEKSANQAAINDKGQVGMQGCNDKTT